MKQNMQSITLTSVAKLIITKELYEKFEKTCRVIKNEEWSGILLYRIKKGNMKDPSKMVIEAFDFLLMNKGSHTHTSFKFDGDFGDYYSNLEDPEGVRWGLVHSHNTMKTFFSTEDISELEDNVDQFAIYLSLIVNNAHNYTAKIARRCKMEYKDVIYKTIDENDDDLNLKITSGDDSIKIKDVLLLNDCNIVMPKHEVEEDDPFMARLFNIASSTKYVNVAAKNTSSKTNSKIKPNHNYGMGFNGGYDKGIHNIEEFDAEDFLLEMLEANSFFEFQEKLRTGSYSDVMSPNNFIKLVEDANPDITDEDKRLFLLDAVRYLEDVQTSYLGGKMYEEFFNHLETYNDVFSSSNKPIVYPYINS